jgi:hypothetical protein
MFATNDLYRAMLVEKYFAFYDKLDSNGLKINIFD